MDSKNALPPAVRILVLDEDDVTRLHRKGAIERDLGAAFVEVLTGGLDIKQLDTLLYGFDPDLVVMAWSKLGAAVLNTICQHFRGSPKTGGRVWVISELPPNYLGQGVLAADLIMTKDICSQNVFRALLGEWYQGWFKRRTQRAAVR